VGTQVSFTLGIDPKSGKDRAQDIHIGNPAAVGGPPLLSGELIEWNQSRACGFIACKDFPGKKFFAHKSEFAEQFEDGQEPPVGTRVGFTIGIDPKSGKDRAQNISLDNGEDRPGEAEGGLGVPRLRGELREWNRGKACGFIALEGPVFKKLFAHKSEFAEPFEDGGEPPVGTIVSFVLGVDAKSGRERAQDIVIEEVHEGPDVQQDEGEEDEGSGVLHGNFRGFGGIGLPATKRARIDGPSKV